MRAYSNLNPTYTPMKKLLSLIAVLCVSMLCSTAQAQLLIKKDFKGRMDADAYLAGAVPETDGKVCFSATIPAEGRTADQIYAGLSQWASFRFSPEVESGEWTDANYFKNTEFARVKEADAAGHVIVCAANEEMVFTNKMLAKDYTLVSYTLTLEATDGAVRATMTDIVYTYTLAEDSPERITAEDWITDSEAINKKGQLYRTVARFRIKTVDLANELFTEIEASAIQ